VDVGDERRARLEALEHRRQLVRPRRLGRDLGHLFYRPPAALAEPGPDRGPEGLPAHPAIYETTRFGGIARGPQLEHELVLIAEIDGLQVLAAVQIPEMQLPAVFGAEQNLGDEALLERIRRAPLARHHGVVAEMPPGVIGELLRAAIHFP